MHEQDKYQCYGELPRFRSKRSITNVLPRQQPQISSARLLTSSIQLQRNPEQDQKIVKTSKKAFIGTGFTLDINEYFKFIKKSNIESNDSMRAIFYEIFGSGIGWIILIYSIVNASFFPIWIMLMKSNKFVIMTWRFLLQALIMIPFVLYEKRTVYKSNSEKYSLEQIFNIKNLKKLYAYSLVNVLWYGVILTAGQYTYLSHVFYLGSLANFFLSLSRHKEQHVHEFEMGGQLMIVVGIFFVFFDTFSFNEDKVKPQDWQTINHSYLARTKNQRFIADLAALIMSVIVCGFQRLDVRLRHMFPTYLSMMILYIMNTVNLAFVAYFINGATFDTAKGWGLFSMFDDNQFAIFLYSALILSIGLVVSFTLVAKLFPNFVIPAISYFLQPGIVTILLNFLNIQSFPGLFSFVGYTMMTPGMGLILIGQWLFVRNKMRKQFMNKIRSTELKQIFIPSSQDLIEQIKYQYKYQELPKKKYFTK